MYPFPTLFISLCSCQESSTMKPQISGLPLFQPNYKKLSQELRSCQPCTHTHSEDKGKTFQRHELLHSTWTLYLKCCSNPVTTSSYHPSSKKSSTLPNTNLKGDKTRTNKWPIIFPHGNKIVQKRRGSNTPNWNTFTHFQQQLHWIFYRALKFAAKWENKHTLLSCFCFLLSFLRT